MNEKLLYAAAAGFEAARELNCLPDWHRSRHLHGHSFRVGVRALLPENWAAFAGAQTGQLAGCLQDTLRDLDYSFLNDTLTLPTDENLVRWIQRQLEVPGIEQVSLASAAHQGARLDRTGRIQLWRRYALQSAHWLPHVAPGHKCGRLHGHGFGVVLHAEQGAAGSLVHDRLDEAWAPLHERLHHVCLNDIPGLENPTSEMISAWLWAQLKPELPELSGVTVHETVSCAAHFDGNNHRIWKEFSIDSAVRLRHAPEEDARRFVHGHTFTLRLHLHAALDRLMGWTVDYGDVKEVFAPLFRQLDHHPLHEIMGDEDADTASIARYIRGRLQPLLPELERIDLYETQGCGVTLDWSGQEPAGLL